MFINIDLEVKIYTSILISHGRHYIFLQRNTENILGN
jgi:hypothetical protein